MSQINVAVEDKQIEALRAIAAQQERSLSYIVRKAIVAFLKQQEAAK